MPLLQKKRYRQNHAGLYVPAPAAGESTVLFDASSIGAILTQLGPGTSSSLAAGDTGNIDIGSGSNGTSNLCLLAAAIFGGANGGTSNFSGGGNGVFWDPTSTNQQMTAIPGATIGNGANGGDIFWFYLMNPTLGAKTLNASWTGSNQVAFALISFVNVDQTGGTTSFPAVATNTGSATATASVPISTTPTTRKIVSAYSTPRNMTTPSGTDIGKNNGLNVFGVGANWDAATASSISYAYDASSAFDGVAVAIKGA